MGGIHKMAITIHKIKSVRKEHGKLTVEVILDDGGNKKVTWLGGLEDDNVSARVAILARGQELFNKGREWDDAPNDIESPAKTFLENLPNLTTAQSAVDNISNLTEAKVIIKKMVNAIFAIKELTE